MPRVPPIARLAAVSLDSTDPAALAGFYRELLGLETYFEAEGFVALKGGGILVTTQRSADHEPPDWPTGPRWKAAKIKNLQLAVTDLDDSEARAVAQSARPSPTRSPTPTSGGAARPRPLLHHHAHPRRLSAEPG